MDNFLVSMTLEAYITIVECFKRSTIGVISYGKKKLMSLIVHRTKISDTDIEALNKVSFFDKKISLFLSVFVWCMQARFTSAFLHCVCDFIGNKFGGSVRLVMLLTFAQF